MKKNLQSIIYIIFVIVAFLVTVKAFMVYENPFNFLENPLVWLVLVGFVLVITLKEFVNNIAIDKTKNLQREKKSNHSKTNKTS